MQIISATLIKKTFTDYDCELCGDYVPVGSDVVRILSRESKHFKFICLTCAEGLAIDRDILEGVTDNAN